MGHSRLHLEAGLQRLREMKHSSITTEQAHKAGSVFMQMHRMYSDSTMRARSFTYQLKLLFNPDPIETQVVKLHHQLDRVLRSNPNKIGAWQAFTSQMISVAKQRKIGGNDLARHYGMEIVSNSHPIYQAYDARRQQELWQIALQMRDGKLQANNDKTKSWFRTSRRPSSSSMCRLRHSH